MNFVPNTKKILSILSYVCFFAVHLTASPLINENIHLRNDLRVFKEIFKSYQKESCTFKSEKKSLKIKKGNLNRRFHPKYFEFYLGLKSTTNFTYRDIKKKTFESSFTHFQLFFNIECRPPPCII